MKLILEDVEDTIASEDDVVTLLNNLRSDIQDELSAIKNYDEHALVADELGYKDVANTLRSIRDEEKTHVGELQQRLKQYDYQFSSSLTDGEYEVAEEDSANTKERHTAEEGPADEDLTEVGD